MIPHNVSVVVHTQGGADVSFSVVRPEVDVAVEMLASLALASGSDDTGSSTEPSASVGTGSEASTPASVAKLVEPSLESVSDVAELDDPVDASCEERTDESVERDVSTVDDSLDKLDVVDASASSLGDEPESTNVDSSSPCVVSPSDVTSADRKRFGEQLGPTLARTSELGTTRRAREKVRRDKGGRDSGNISS